MLYVAYHITVQVIAHLSLHLYIHSINNIPYQLIKNKKPEKGKAISINFTDIIRYYQIINKIAAYIGRNHRKHTTCKTQHPITNHAILIFYQILSTHFKNACHNFSLRLLITILFLLF